MANVGSSVGRIGIMRKTSYIQRQVSEVQHYKTHIRSEIQARTRIMRPLDYNLIPHILRQERENRQIKEDRIQIIEDLAYVLFIVLSVLATVAIFLS